MRGDLHRRLQAELQRAWKAGVFKQESLSARMGKSQRSISQYLRGDPDAGALDLDEADAALRHIGSSLEDFLARLPPRDLTVEERLANELVARPALKQLVVDLLDVPRTQLAAVRELVHGLVLPAIGRRGGKTGGS